MFTHPGMLTPYAYYWCATRYVDHHWAMPDNRWRLSAPRLWKGKNAEYVGTNTGMWEGATYWASVKQMRLQNHVQVMEERTQAVGMGLHARLGAASPIRALDGHDELFRMIMDIATPTIMFNG